MACPENEGAKIAELFDEDMFSVELKELTLTCGGKEIDQRIAAIVRHANNLGYMEMVARDD